MLSGLCTGVSALPLYDDVLGSPLSLADFHHRTNCFEHDIVVSGLLDRGVTVRLSACPAVGADTTSGISLVLLWHPCSRYEDGSRWPYGIFEIDSERSEVGPPIILLAAAAATLLTPLLGARAFVHAVLCYRSRGAKCAAEKWRPESRQYHRHAGYQIVIPVLAIDTGESEVFKISILGTSSESRGGDVRWGEAGIQAASCVWRQVSGRSELGMRSDQKLSSRQLSIDTRTQA